MGRYQKPKWKFQQLFAKKMSLQKEMEVAFEAKDAFEWADLAKVIPVEDVKIDKNGTRNFMIR